MVPLITRTISLYTHYVKKGLALQTCIIWYQESWPTSRFWFCHQRWAVLWTWSCYYTMNRGSIAVAFLLHRCNIFVLYGTRLLSRWRLQFSHGVMLTERNWWPVMLAGEKWCWQVKSDAGRWEVTLECGSNVGMWEVGRWEVVLTWMFSWSDGEEWWLMIISSWSDVD